jgi:uncharacterized membrane protein YsdA (DUF1294 family)
VPTRHPPPPCLPSLATCGPGGLGYGDLLCLFVGVCVLLLRDRGRWGGDLGWRWCSRLRLAAGQRGEAARDHRVVGFTVAAPWSRSRELELLAVALLSGSFGNPWVASQGSERKLRIMAPVAAMLTSVALVGIVVGSLFVLGLWVKTLVPYLDSAATVLYCIFILL